MYPMSYTCFTNCVHPRKLQRTYFPWFTQSVIPASLVRVMIPQQYQWNNRLVPKVWVMTPQQAQKCLLGCKALFKGLSFSPNKLQLLCWAELTFDSSIPPPSHTGSDYFPQNSCANLTYILMVGNILSFRYKNFWVMYLIIIRLCWWPMLHGMICGVWHSPPSGEMQLEPTRKKSICQSAESRLWVLTHWSCRILGSRWLSIGCQDNMSPHHCSIDKMPFCVTDSLGLIPHWVLWLISFNHSGVE